MIGDKVTQRIEDIRLENTFSTNPRPASCGDRAGTAHPDQVNRSVSATGRGNDPKVAQLQMVHDGDGDRNNRWITVHGAPTTVWRRLPGDRQVSSPSKVTHNCTTGFRWALGTNRTSRFTRPPSVPGAYPASESAIPRT
ncbi:hypothetical protein AAFF_G00050550 [Aldrovandia affinis]|uniref:Uncharacterized protein n=1 Tax=Aldrovandia affinis TaxID=143900 RepID=A0AAD7T4A9_9TELE|nr:hypothetical protein AAFF_G00050550 [Aldrovandia affinis]